MRQTRKLKPRERLFCGYYAGTGDAERAAKQAGYRGDCRLIGGQLLCDEAVLAEIDRQLDLRRRTLPRMAAVGYQRLAFGSVSDALRLLFMEKPTAEQLEEMDLYMISDIKRNRDGMLEIKFFDRLKALDKLHAGEDTGADMKGLFDAIGRQAASGSEDDA